MPPDPCSHSEAWTNLSGAGLASCLDCAASKFPGFPEQGIAEHKESARGEPSLVHTAAKRRRQERRKPPADKTAAPAPKPPGDGATFEQHGPQTRSRKTDTFVREASQKGPLASSSSVGCFARPPLLLRSRNLLFASRHAKSYSRPLRPRPRRNSPSLPGLLARLGLSAANPWKIEVEKIMRQRSRGKLIGSLRRYARRRVAQSNAGVSDAKPGTATGRPCPYGWPGRL